MPNSRIVGSIALASVVAWAGLVPHAWADGDMSVRTPVLPKYQQDCGACHVPYPPTLLPEPSWQRIMGNLGRHYGVDASVDAATTKDLSAWLAKYAGNGKRATKAPPEDRITRSAWFRNEHDEVNAATWKLPAVKSPSNCGACHTKAGQGDFNEYNIRIPR